jgi:hypothetical protein
MELLMLVVQTINVTLDLVENILFAVIVNVKHMLVVALLLRMITVTEKMIRMSAVRQMGVLGMGVDLGQGTVRADRTPGEDPPRIVAKIKNMTHQ